MSKRPHKKVTCEVCNHNEVPAVKHFRCHFCGRHVCPDCASFMGVRIAEYPRSRLHTMRICPYCKPKFPREPVRMKRKG